MTGLVAGRVRRLRMELRWSAQRLADECAREGCDSLTRGTIAKIESGARKSVTADEVAVLARVLGVTPTDLLTPERQAIVAIDVACFTAPDRTEAHQLAMHEGLYRVLQDAFADAGVDWDACKKEDRSDGALILVPAEVPKSRLADQLPSRLVAGLLRHNAVHAAEAAINLRVAVHAGEVRHDEHGAVSQAVNLTCRLLQAPAVKSALRSSTGVLALIASDRFYHEVITQDPGTDPDSYRRIPVEVKETSTVGWLRLLPDHPGAADVESQVLDLLPAAELKRVQEWLAKISLPQLPTLVHRAAGPGVPPSWSAANAWEAFCYLAEFNAGADGFPPTLTFVELLAGQVGGEVSANLRRWNDDQAHHLGLQSQLWARRAAGAARLPADSRLHLMIVLDPDGIDPHRYQLSYWRQDDPAEWPPPRGETRMVTLAELERRVDELVVSAEQAWSGHTHSVTLEFVLPRVLLNQPVHLWHKEHDSGDPQPLCLAYPVVVRSLERMRSSQWHRVWRQRWRLLMDDPSAARVHFGQPTDAQERHHLDALLGDPQWVLMVLTAPPPPQPQPGADELTAALRSGLPALVWHPEASSEALREVVTQLIEGDGLRNLPERVQHTRRVAFRAPATPAEVNITRGLVVLWDDPGRLVVPHQSADQTQMREDIADERERAS
ncbi:MAG: helix-turn-helix transcriptional regulator [Pseudonocardiales bacterium]|nr:helix-turn-helix transcriptional regulator [Pseudonocardiales bacterium]